MYGKKGEYWPINTHLKIKDHLSLGNSSTRSMLHDFFPLNEGQKMHLKTKSGWIYKWYLIVWNLCSIMSKQNRKSTEKLYLEQLEDYKDLFWLSGWVSALSYAVSVIVLCMGKLSINAMPRAIHENSEKTSKISSPLLYSLENSAFLHTTEWTLQHRETF